MTVTRDPCAASRRISISLSPPALPAICSALGRPRTSTSVDWPGFDCTIAPAFRAAAMASLRGRIRNPVNDRRFPFRLLIAADLGSFGRCRSAAISSPAAS